MEGWKAVNAMPSPIYDLHHTLMYCAKNVCSEVPREQATPMVMVYFTGQAAKLIS